MNLLGKLILVIVACYPVSRAEALETCYEKYYSAVRGLNELTSAQNETVFFLKAGLGSYYKGAVPEPAGPEDFYDSGLAAGSFIGGSLGCGLVTTALLTLPTSFYAFPLLAMTSVSLGSLCETGVSYAVLRSQEPDTTSAEYSRAKELYEKRRDEVRRLNGYINAYNTQIHDEIIHLNTYGASQESYAALADLEFSLRLLTYAKNGDTDSLENILSHVQSPAVRGHDWRNLMRSMDSNLIRRRLLEIANSEVYCRGGLPSSVVLGIVSNPLITLREK